MDILLRLFCLHRETIRRVEGKRLFVECLRCGHCSPGITTGPEKLNHQHPRPRFALLEE